MNISVLIYCSSYFIISKKFCLLVRLTDVIEDFYGEAEKSNMSEQKISFVINTNINSPAI